MAKFLSEAWCAEMADAVSKDPAIAGVRFTVQQIVKDTPDGEVAYWTRFDDGTVTAGVGKADAADVTITQDYATACELARAELVAQAAFMQGRLKVTGSMGALLQNQAAIAALGPAASSLDTSY